MLPGMDSIFSLLALVRLLGLFGKLARRSHQNDKFDIIIYDGISTEETLRMIGASSKARFGNRQNNLSFLPKMKYVHNPLTLHRLYLKYLRSMAEKTDLGRLAGPSLLRLVDEAMGISGNPSQFTGPISAEIWDSLERILEVTTEWISFYHSPSFCYRRLREAVSCAERIFRVLSIWVLSCDESKHFNINQFSITLLGLCNPS